MAQHELKTDPKVFEAVFTGAKTYEIRKDDRGFSVGDVLILKETTHSGAEMKAGAPLVYTGRSVLVSVSHILRGPIYGLEDGWVLLSFSRRQIIGNELDHDDETMNISYLQGKEDGKETMRKGCEALQKQVFDLQAENEKLSKRCYPSEVALINGTVHYVSETVYLELNRLKAIESSVKEFKAATLAHVKTVADGSGGAGPVVTYDEMRAFERRIMKKLFKLIKLTRSNHA